MDKHSIQNDFLNYESDKEILSIIKEGNSNPNPETLLLSDKIIKINRYNMSQERNVIVTNKALYNLKKKSKFNLTQHLKEE
jgi:hypothetical protein